MTPIANAIENTTPMAVLDSTRPYRLKASMEVTVSRPATKRPKEQTQGITRAKHQIRTDHAGEHRVRQCISHQRLATENQEVAQEGAAHKHQNGCEQGEQIESGNQIHGSAPCRS